MAIEDKLTSRIVILLSKAEKDLFKIIARDESRSVSGHMRYLCLKEIDKHLDDA
jgi:hypothetical protein